jgi:hypothetical protein
LLKHLVAESAPATSHRNLARRPNSLAATPMQLITIQIDILKERGRVRERNTLHPQTLKNNEKSLKINDLRLPTVNH